jgi:hypothetical protein
MKPDPAMISAVMAELGRRAGKARTAKTRRTVRRNGRSGGRPRKEEK